MSKERYEIKGKIGEGGVGSVYHAYDTHLNRDVAIKRVLADGGYEDQEDATKSLLKEATALSSVQHPHIVTVYDAGVDDDGPYVVMELINGRTLNEMVERAILTWEDLREVALQSQEALIAAQDLNLVHRDLKPSNIMVCWLPSGKFQVKIVDFGLAKFSATPSLQTIAHGDAVFGSIFFMAPEQFERIPLDKCTDMYSMGCLYYYALTGEYPFNGETAAMVMAAHLQHHVTPIHELRPDIPKWGADWIMWHIEREMQNRPQDARESLSRFLLLEQSTQAVTVAATDGTAPQFNFPTQGAAAPQSETPQSIAPLSAGLNVHPDIQPVQARTAPQFATGPQPVQAGTAPHFLTGPQPAQARTAPQFATGPQPVQAGTAPHFLTGPQPAQARTAPQFATPQQPGQLTDPVDIQAQGDTVTENPAEEPPVKKPLNPVIKWTIIGLLSLIILVTAILIYSQSDKRRDAKFYNETMIEAKKLNDSEELQKGLLIDKGHLNALLKKAGSNTANKNRGLQRAALAYAKGKGFDADKVIVDYLTKAKINSNIRKDLFKYVMPHRANVDNIQPLLDFAAKEEKSSVATQAIKATYASCEEEGTEEYLPDYLSIITDTSKDDIRKAAEKAASIIIQSSHNKDSLALKINKAYKGTVEDMPKYSLLRLMAFAGGEDAAETFKSALQSDNKLLRNSAITALANWPDDKLFPLLIDFIKNANKPNVRREAFKSAYNFLKTKQTTLLSSQLQKMWESLASVAKSQREKEMIIFGMKKQTEKWAIPILEKLMKDKDDKISDLAEQAKDEVLDNLK